MALPQTLAENIWDDKIPIYPSPYNFYSNHPILTSAKERELFNKQCSDVWSTLNPLVSEISSGKTASSSSLPSSKFVLLYLHGLGGLTPREFKNLTTTVNNTFVNASGALEITIIAPQAPQIPITMSYGMEFSAWADLKGFGEEEGQDLMKVYPKGFGNLHNSVILLRYFIQEVCSRYLVSPPQIVLGGFSQGGALALCTLLQNQYNFAGVFCHSGFYPTLDSHIGHLQLSRFAQWIQQDNMGRAIPTFISHGGNDDIIKLWTNFRLINEYKKAGLYNEYTIFRHYPTLHHTPSYPAVTNDFMKWLFDVINCPNEPSLKSDLSPLYVEVIHPHESPSALNRSRQGPSSLACEEAGTETTTNYRGSNNIVTKREKTHENYKKQDEFVISSPRLHHRTKSKEARKKTHKLVKKIIQKLKTSPCCCIPCVNFIIMVFMTVIKFLVPNAFQITDEAEDDEDGEIE